MDLNDGSRHLHLVIIGVNWVLSHFKAYTRKQACHCLNKIVLHYTDAEL